MYNKIMDICNMITLLILLHITSLHQVQLLPSPANARYPLYSWAGWSNVSKVSCSRKQQQTALSGNQTWASRITQDDPKPPGCCCPTMSNMSEYNLTA